MLPRRYLVRRREKLAAYSSLPTAERLSVSRAGLRSTLALAPSSSRVHLTGLQGLDGGLRHFEEESVRRSTVTALLQVVEEIGAAEQRVSVCEVPVKRRRGDALEDRPRVWLRCRRRRRMKR